MSTGSGGWKPTSALLAATAVWGATFVTVKDALAASDVFTFLTLRFAVGALAAAGLALVLKRRSAPAGELGSGGREDSGARRAAEDLRPRSDSATRAEPGAAREHDRGDVARGSDEGSRKSASATRGEAGSPGFLSVVRPGLQLGVLLFGGYALQTLGLETTTPARSAFITGLTVIFVPFVSWWMNGHRPPTRAFVAPFIALIGLQRLTGVTFSGSLPVGDALTLGCAVVYAVHIVGMGKWGKGAPALELTAVQLGLVAVLSACTLPFIERRFEPSAGFWAAVVFTGVFASAIAIAVQVWAQAQVNATRAAVIFSLEPVFALATAVLSGLGWPSPAELVGCGFILAAVLISEVELAPLRRLRPLSRGP